MSDTLNASGEKLSCFLLLNKIRTSVKVWPFRGEEVLIPKGLKSKILNRRRQRQFWSFVALSWSDWSWSLWNYVNLDHSSCNFKHRKYLIYRNLYSRQAWWSSCWFKFISLLGSSFVIARHWEWDSWKTDYDKTNLGKVSDIRTWGLIKTWVGTKERFFFKVSLSINIYLDFK